MEKENLTRSEITSMLWFIAPISANGGPVDPPWRAFKQRVVVLCVMFMFYKVQAPKKYTLVAQRILLPD